MAYAERPDIESIFGASNVETWANLENEVSGSTDHVNNRITSALAYAENFIERRLKVGPYAIPLSPVDSIVTDIAARLAGLWLYEGRGVQDWDQETGRPAHKLQWHRVYVEEKLRMILAGQIQLSAATSRPNRSNRSPFVVRST